MSIRRNITLASQIALAAGAVSCAGAAVLVGQVAAARKRSRRGKLAGKVALITGSSRGLGLAIAEEFARAGARIVLTARDPEELQRARKLLLRRGALENEEDAAVFSCDLTSDEQTRKLIRAAVERFGAIDILVNNAGIITVGPVEHQTLEIFERTMNVNFYGMLHPTLAVLPEMLARGSGSIVNICSIGGKIAVPHLLPYSASKFAAVGFSEGLHAELRSKGIRVTTVCPGLMRTGSYVQAYFTGDHEKEYRWFSLGASLPGISTSASHAAQRILRATLRGEAEITITAQAAFAARANGIAPACVSRAMALVNQMVLPAPPGTASEVKQGKQTRDRPTAPLRALGQRAGFRYNQGG